MKFHQRSYPARAIDFFSFAWVIQNVFMNYILLHRMVLLTVSNEEKIEILGSTPMT